VTNATPFRIGADAGRYLGGRVDQVSFYKRVLSAAERKQHYNSGDGFGYGSVSQSEPHNLIPFLSVGDGMSRSDGP